MNAAEARLFVGRWLRDPRGVGAVLPSSAALGDAVARAAVEAPNSRAVVELGGGTGAITSALLRAGVSAGSLVVVERDRRLHDHLRRNFPGIRLIAGDARDLPALLADAGIDAPGVIASGLPLRSLGSDVRRAITAASAATLTADGVFLQYTYGVAPPVPRSLQRDLGWSGAPVARVWRNVPPATVWRFSRIAG